MKKGITPDPNSIMKDEGKVKKEYIMAINSVDMDRALNSASYAQQALRSGKITADQKGQLIAKWGADKVSQWSSVDGTEYVIDDASYDAAKQAGKDATAESVGYDGGKNFRSVADAGLSVTGAGAAAVSVISTGLHKVVGEGAKTVIAAGAQEGATESAKAASKSMAKGQVSAYVAAGIAIATAALYWAKKPNDKQVEATQQILQSELPQGQNSLYEAQSNMEDATEEVTELAEEAEAMDEDTDENIEEQKTLFDFYRNQYEAIKTKAESGVPLTLDEKALAEKLAPVMTEIGEGILTLGEETTEGVNKLYDDIGEYQEAYDEAGETIAEVEGMTDFAEGFDETTRTMCYVEAAAQGLNAVTGGVAAAKLMAGGPWNWALGIAAGIAAGSSTLAVNKELNNANLVSNEIGARRDVQELGVNTTGIYGDELDNFEGNKEVVEDLELKMPEDLKVPDPIATTGDDGGDPMAMAAAGAKNNEQNNAPVSPLTGGVNNNEQNNAPVSPLTGAQGSQSNATANNTQSQKTDESDEKVDPNKKKEDVK